MDEIEMTRNELHEMYSDRLRVQAEDTRRIDVHHHRETELPPPTFSGEVEKNSRGTNWRVTINGARSAEEFAACLAAGAERVRDLLGE